MSEQQKTTDFVYTSEDGVEFNVSLPGERSQEEVLEWARTYGEETEIAAGIREPGFGPFTMGAVPTEAVETGLYGARQALGTLGRELGLISDETAAKDKAYMERLKGYSREQARREDFASGDIVIHPETGELVREGQIEYEQDQETMRDIVNAEGFSDAIKAFASNPDAILPVIGESLGTFAPALLGTIGAGILTGGMGTAGIVMTALAGGLGSGATEYGVHFTEAFKEQGVDVTDDRAVLNALNDPDKLSEIREEATKRGVAIGAFDAATIGFAGKLTNLIKGKALSTKRAEAGLTRGAAAGTAELGAQAIGGGAGEAVAQALTGEYKPGEIFIEAIAEAPTALIEVPLSRNVRGERRLKNFLETEVGLNQEGLNSFSELSSGEQRKVLKGLREAKTPAEREILKGDLRESLGLERGRVETEVRAEPDISEQSAPEVDLNNEARVELERIKGEKELTTEELEQYRATVGDPAPASSPNIEDNIDTTREVPAVDTTPAYDSTEVRKIKADYARTKAEQEKREALLNDPAAMAARAEYTGETIESQTNTVRTNYQNNIDTLNKLEQTVNSPEFQAAEQARKEKVASKDIKFKDITETQVDTAVDTTLPEEVQAEETETVRVAEKGEAFSKAAEVVSTSGPEFTNVDVEITDDLRATAEGVGVEIAENDDAASVIENIGEVVEAYNAAGKALQDTDSSNNPETRGMVHYDIINNEYGNLSKNSRDKLVEIFELAEFERSGEGTEATKSEEQAVAEGGTIIIEGLEEGKAPNEVLNDATNNIYNEFEPAGGIKNLKDLTKWANWIHFPDYIAELYPNFSNFFRGVTERERKASKLMAEFWLPVTAPLSLLKSRAQIHDVAKAIELLDQTRTDYTTNGEFDINKVPKDPETGKYILRNPGGENVKTELSSPTEEILLSEEELAVVAGIRKAVRLATQKVIQTSNNMFGFARGANVINLTELANDIQLAADNGMSPAQIDDIMLSSNLIFNEEEARTTKQGLLNPNVTVEQRINAIRNYVNLLKKFDANPNYFQHMRAGDMGIAVKDGNGNTVYLQTARSQDYRKALTIGKRSAKGTRIRSPISITPLEASRRMMAELAPELQSRIEDGEFGPGATLKIVDFNKDRLENHAITLTDLSTTENVFNVLMNRLTLDPFEGVGKSKEAKQEAVAENRRFLEELVGTAKQNMLNNMYRGGVENAPERKNIPGWITSETAPEVLTETLEKFFARSAGYVANEETKKMRENGLASINPTHQRKLLEYANEFNDYIESGSHDIAQMKRLAFHYFLGLNPSSALINLTQLPMATVPWLIRFSPTLSAQTEVMAAMRDAGKLAGVLKGLHKTGTGNVQEILQRVEMPKGWKNTEANRQLWVDVKEDMARGLLMAQVTAEQAGIVQYGIDGNVRSTVNKLENISSSIFTYAELINRLTTYIAAHRTYTKRGANVEKVLENNPDYQAVKQIGGRGAADFAAFTVDKTQFLMGVANRPKFMRGPVAGVLTQFMQFPVRYLQLIDSLVFRDGGIIKNPAERGAALAYMAAFMMLTGGFWSLPLAENAKDLYEFIYKTLYQMDPTIKDKLNTQLQLMGMENPKYFTRGVLPQLLNISLGTRTGAGRVIQPDFFSGDATKALGPAGSMIFGSANNALVAAQHGNYFMAFANLLPTAFYNGAKAINMVTLGEVYSARGKKLPNVELDMSDVVSQLIGFQPEKVSQEYEASWFDRRAKTRVSDLRQAYNDQITTALTKYYSAEKKRDEARTPETKQKLTKRMNEALAEYISLEEEIADHNKDVVEGNFFGVAFPDYSYMINASPASRKALHKNAQYMAHSIPKAPPKVQRPTEYCSRYFRATPQGKENFVKQNGMDAVVYCEGLAK